MKTNTLYMILLLFIILFNLYQSSQIKEAFIGETFGPYVRPVHRKIKKNVLKHTDNIQHYVKKKLRTALQ